MKIYFDSDLYDECLSPCPHGKDCMVGSVYCDQCKYNMYTKKYINGVDGENAIFFVGDKASMRTNDHVECTCGEKVSIWRLIKLSFKGLF